MAVEKSDASVQSVAVQADGSLLASVNYAITDGSSLNTRVVVNIVVSNATTAEKNAAASVRDKAAILAVA
jgi:hypothetical protein